MASSSAGNSTLPSDWRPYPPPMCTYNEVVNSSQKFLESLQKLHATMGTKFMIPIVGGKDLDLHRLFVEVTTRGGITKILKERRWKDITAVFSFPSSATNASFILRKYYCSLLLHYEQIYFFKAKGWSPSALQADPLQQVSTILAPPQGFSEPGLFSPEIQVATPQQQRVNEGMSHPQVHGVIDGKFESGYLITVKIGSEEYKGVLYQVPLNPSNQVPHSGSQHQSALVNSAGNSSGAPGRRKRRKKSEMKKRDPAHPKPNRSGYNFFFAEQHARLKPLYPGKDREISRMIGELWTNLKEPERAVYQETALRDKERYRIEMEAYKEKLRTGQIVTDAVPIQQQPPEPEDVSAMNIDVNLQTEAADSHNTGETGTSSDKSGKSSDDNASAGKELEDGATLEAEDVLKNLAAEISAKEAALESQDRVESSRDADRPHEDNAGVMNKEALPTEHETAALVKNEIPAPRG